MLSKDEAVEWLNGGEVVAIPTETVYGLAARIDCEQAIQNIFKIKERPFFDPLIVHVSSIEQARKYSRDWTELHQILAELFWPGPLTLVLPKTADVSDWITSSLPTVGLRCPNHPLTQQIIESVGVPLAAPSANKFGKTSPTSAQHVLESLPGVEVIDGGECQVGIESTILYIDSQPSPLLSILRPGMVSKKMIEEALKGHSWQWVNTKSTEVTPGSLEDHYMPDVPLVLIDSQSSKEEVLVKIKALVKKDDVLIETLNLPEQSYLAARKLYGELRRLGKSKDSVILFQVHPFMRTEDWQPLMDRLRKAASYCF